MLIDTQNDTYLRRLLSMCCEELETTMLAQPISVLRDICQDITEIFYDDDHDPDLERVQLTALSAISKHRREALKSA